MLMQMDVEFIGFTHFLEKASDCASLFGGKNKMCREVSGFVG
jgi:hypothetical protein